MSFPETNTPTDDVHKFIAQQVAITILADPATSRLLECLAILSGADKSNPKGTAVLTFGFPAAAPAAGSAGLVAHASPDGGTSSTGWSFRLNVQQTGGGFLQINPDGSFVVSVTQPGVTVSASGSPGTTQPGNSPDGGTPDGGISDDGGIGSGGGGKKPVTQ